MAQHLDITEIRNYQLMNGTTVDLVALIANGVPADRRAPVMEELAVGQVAYVDAMGEMRRGVITKLGRTRVHVTFTTQGAIDHQARYQSSAGIRVQTTAAALGEIRVAPLSVPEQVTEALLVGDEDAIQALADELDGPLEAPEETAEREAEQEELEGVMTVEEEAEFLAEVRTTEAEAAELDAMLADWEGEGGAVEAEYPCEGAEQGVCGGEPHSEDCPSYVAPLDPITGSAIVAVLEETWEAIRANHTELPHVVIVTGSGFIGSPRWAHWRESGWTERQGEGEHAHTRHGEMFVAGEALARGAKHVVESMLHEGAHTLATVRSLQDTSRQGRWHNGVFRKLAEELGLEFRGDKADGTHGFSNMLLTAGTEAEYAELIKKLDAAIRAVIRIPAFVAGASEGQGGGEYVHGGRRPKGETKGPNTNNLKLTCKCVDEETGEPKPRIIRASRREAERGQMMCGVCRDYFEDRSGE